VKKRDFLISDQHQRDEYVWCCALYECDV